MSKQNKKKMGYNQYERLLSLAHQKLEILAEKFHELQTYFIAYVEYRGDNLEFNDSSDIINFMSYYMKSNSTRGVLERENKTKQSLGVVIKGFADARGTVENNYKLSRNRSNEVRRFIEMLNVRLE